MPIIHRRDFFNIALLDKILVHIGDTDYTLEIPYKRLIQTNEILTIEVKRKYTRRQKEGNKHYATNKKLATKGRHAVGHEKHKDRRDHFRV